MTIEIYDDVFTRSQFSRISKLLHGLKPIKDKRSKERKSLVLDYDIDGEIYDIIYKNKKLRNKIENCFSVKHGLRQGNPSFPVEFRIYPPQSKGMPKHKDISMFSPHAFECVLTITNSSDSKFVFDDGGKWVEITPRPNQIIIVRPGETGAMHYVTPITNGGTRSILKFVYEQLNKNGTNRKTAAFKKEVESLF